MLLHALKIIQTELETHLAAYSPTGDEEKVLLENLSEGLASSGGTVTRDRLIFSFVNYREEKALKNLPTYARNDATLTARYENPPVFLNFLLLVTATHVSYEKALLYLSRSIRFFQSKNVFTPDTVAPATLLAAQPLNALDRLATFKLILDIYSPSLEEVNHLWGTLGGKQYPHVLYLLRLLDLRYEAIERESGLITEVVSEFYHRNPSTN
ncbi:Pvc16 family protein [Hymenobacter daeguensis]